MKKKNKNVMTYSRLEKWSTRNGESVRVVIRTADGKFYDNVSLSALI